MPFYHFHQRTSEDVSIDVSIIAKNAASKRSAALAREEPVPMVSEHNKPMAKVQCGFSYESFI